MKIEPSSIQDTLETLSVNSLSHTNCNKIDFVNSDSYKCMYACT